MKNGFLKKTKKLKSFNRRSREDSEHIEDLEYDEDDDFEYEEDDEEVDGEVVEKRKNTKRQEKKNSITMVNMNFYPKENWKQIRFYRRRAIPLAASYHWHFSACFLDLFLLNITPLALQRS